ncbi:transcriptional repressor LexA [Actinoplanes sp. RD1]|uniref:transcriptional repressor LexA n=1 Tax=Actinoplanes sp. RD1 TaxID=3064538 RepID=UPI002741E87C|nr:transcriptional repressor LexA [Actinoplanes sp. RD1]
MEPGADSPALSAQQQRILAVVAASIRERGYPPTVREIGARVGLRSPSTVAHHLQVLEQQGLLRRAAGSPRAVELRDAAPAPGRTVDVPLLGTVAAGFPRLADQSPGDVLTLPATLVGPGTCFALKVRGDSMTDAGIVEGDTIVIRRQPAADDGDIVAALLGDEATIKVLRHREGHAELVPRNPAYPVLAADDAVILGKAVCVLRSLP